MKGFLSEQTGGQDIQQLTESATDQVSGFTSGLWKWASDTDMWWQFLFSSIRIVLIFILTQIAIKVISKVIERSLQGKDKTRLRTNPRRFITIGELLKNVVSSVFNFIMIMLVLNEFGFNLTPLLTGAGVAGLAISFGAQSIVKDIITGFFIIFEDQFAVGDVIQVGLYKGTVQMVGLRTTRLVSWNGEVNIIPNGSIISVTNFSLSNSLAVVDVPLKLERSMDDALKLVKQAVEELKDDHPEMLKMPEVLGIQSLTTAEYAIRIVAECQPNSRAGVERAVQTALKKALDHEEEERLLLEAKQQEEEAQKAKKQEAADRPLQGEGELESQVKDKRDENISNDQ